MYLKNYRMSGWKTVSEMSVLEKWLLLSCLSEMGVHCCIWSYTGIVPAKSCLPLLQGKVCPNSGYAVLRSWRLGCYELNVCVPLPYSCVGAQICNVMVFGSIAFGR